MKTRSRIRRASGLIAALVITIGIGAALTSSASAECNPGGILPTLKEASATAKTIVIGDVVAVRSGGSWDPSIDGRSSRFTLAVRIVVRGTAPPELSVQDLITRPCAGEVIVRFGDRVVLALDARETNFAGTFSTVAWITGQPPQGAGAFERVTDAQVLALAGPALPEAPTPERATLPPASGQVVDPLAPAGAPVEVLLVLVVLAVVAVGLLARRLVGAR
jgi:hypothetical protein